MVGIDHLIKDRYVHGTTEHCVCPTGYSGLSCEVPTQLCPDGIHVCFHGSVCVYEEEKYKCDCDETDTAGLFCQHKATVECNNGGVEFCVNSGECTDDGKCRCQQGYQGA